MLDVYFGLLVRKIAGLTEAAGLAIEYKNLHKFRHGYIRMMRDQAKDVIDLEALAGNTLQKLGTMLEYGRKSERQRHQWLDDMSSLID